MTMASLMAHPPPSGHQPTPSTTSKLSSTLLEPTATKFDTCCINNKSYSISLVLQEIPTRNSLQESFNTVVDPLNDVNDNCNIMTTMLYSTTLEETAAPLPYQSELAAITAAIEQMKHNDETSQKTECPMHPTLNTQSMLAATSTLHRWRTQG